MLSAMAEGAVQMVSVGMCDEICEMSSRVALGEEVEVRICSRVSGGSNHK